MFFMYSSSVQHPVVSEPIFRMARLVGVTHCEPLSLATIVSFSGHSQFMFSQLRPPKTNHCPVHTYLTHRAVFCSWPLAKRTVASMIAAAAGEPSHCWTRCCSRLWAAQASTASRLNPSAPPATAAAPAAQPACIPFYLPCGLLNQ